MEAPAEDDGGLRKKIIAIQLDKTLTDAQKAQKRQELMAGKWMVAQKAAESEEEEEDDGVKHKGKAPTANGKETTIFDETLKCAMCMDLCNRPITAPCQHNFCLGCFNKWAAQGKKTCPTCRHPFPAKWAANPRINTALTSAIRMAKLGERPAAARAVARINDKDRPDEAFTTDRAVRAGRANAASGRIMVTVPGDHFGPIPPEADPRGLGVRVGEHWKDRLDCRQWGAHFPHVAGIAGQSGQGAQSVVLSGGYEDDRDEGEWFLYTGSGGRDLSGNKRVTSVQSFDQTFEKMNKALLLSCQRGLPVRVVRSAKEKRSAYAPGEDQPVRYDGIYRIARAYRKPGAQGKLVCRYLFIRCDNEPAPWSSEDTGDTPWDADLPPEALTEIKAAKGTVFEMGAKAWWDWSAEKEEWGWTRPAPVSTRSNADPSASPKKLRRKASEHERALRDFTCKLCKCVLSEPLSTPCGHHFCKPCLTKKFEARDRLAAVAVIWKVPRTCVVGRRFCELCLTKRIEGLGDMDDAGVARAASAGRTMRVRKVVKPCPACKADIGEFLVHGQVNRGMIEVIAKLQAAARKAQADAATLEAGGAAAADADEDVEAEAEAEAEAELDEALAAADGGSAPAGEGAGTDPGEGAGPTEGTNLGDAAPGASKAAQPDAPAAAAAAAAAPPDAGPGVAGASAGEMAALAADFPEFDGALLAGMVEDQGGDVAERMRNQTAAADRKAKRAAAGPPAAKPAAARGRPAKKAKKGAAAKEGPPVNGGAAEAGAAIVEREEPENEPPAAAGVAVKDAAAGYVAVVDAEAGGAPAAARAEDAAAAEEPAAPEAAGAEAAASGEAGEAASAAPAAVDGVPDDALTEPGAVADPAAPAAASAKGKDGAQGGGKRKGATAKKAAPACAKAADVGGGMEVGEVTMGDPADAAAKVGPVPRAGSKRAASARAAAAMAAAASEDGGGSGTDEDVAAKRARA